MLDTQRAEYFRLLQKEDYLNTPKLTKKIDELEVEIRKLTKKVDEFELEIRKLS